MSWPPPPAAAGGAYLSATEVAEIADLMAELRDLTRSRKTFRITSAFLAKIGRLPPGESRIVEAE